MRFTPSIFGKLLEPIDRRRFQAIVDRHDGDAYDKSFTSLDHLLALVFAQLSGAGSLRALEVTWNAAAGSLFVTRPKTSMKLVLAATRDVPEATPEQREADGFTVLLDEEVALASKGDSKLPVGLRRLRVRRHADGKTIELLTNDLARSARAIGALYRGRWQIELLFRWLKQHLRIRKFLGNNDNAIRLQIYAAMIAFALLRIAARTHRLTIPILRFIDLVGRYLLERRHIAAIDKPPTVNPSAKRDRTSPNQMAFAYA